MPHSLQGKKILLTREKAPSLLMAEEIRALGGEAVIAPVMKMVPNPLSPSEREAVKRINAFDWIIFTSSNGVKYFIKHAESLGINISKPKIAAVGSKTAKAVQDYGLTVHRMPVEFTAEGLAEQFSQNGAHGSSILLALGQLAKSELERHLQLAGCRTMRIDVYKTEANEGIKDDLSRILLKNDIDVVTFASPSAIDFFLSLTEHLNLHEFWSRAIVACIGKVSAAHANKRGLSPQIVPEVFTAQSLIEAIADYYKSN
ncbi:MAG: uroporphyrinogen-III synthase [Tuberibacillus sp.]